jgi:hypothetical protein
LDLDDAAKGVPDSFAVRVEVSSLSRSSNLRAPRASLLLAISKDEVDRAFSGRLRRVGGLDRQRETQGHGKKGHEPSPALCDGLQR